MTETETAPSTQSLTTIRRYPVKAMGGESLASVEVDERGLVGDRWYAVVDADGRLACGKDTRRFKRYDEVFGFAAATSDRGVWVSGSGASWLVGDPALDAELSRSLGAPVAVRPEAETMHFDDSPVSVVGTATLAWVRDELGLDGDSRRIRVNLVVETPEPFEEESWSTDLTIGSTAFRPVKRITRCRTVDLAQDGVPTVQPLLKALGATRDLQLGIYLDVVTPGRLAVGDRVEL